jgi:hypothetical protein
VQAIDTIQCIVGPRYIDRLTFSSILVLGTISIAWAIVAILRGCSRVGGRSRLAANVRVAATDAASVATAVSIQVLFLLYPLSCAFICRTWVCDTYIVDGEEKQFMADDKFVECGSPEYGTLVAVALALVIVVIIGMPALQYWMLRRWRKPLDRLFVATEDGHRVPSTDGRLILGEMYVLYKPHFYLGAIADAVVKLVLTAVLGVVFKDAQTTGLVIAGILCVALGFIFAVFTPFVHRAANYIVLATYISLVATCAEMAVAYNMVLAEQTQRAKALHSVLQTITLMLYMLPFAWGVWDLFEMSSSPCYRCAKACVNKTVNAAKAATASACKDNAAAALSATRNVARAERIRKRNRAIVIKVKRISRDALRDGRRSQCLAMLLSDLRPLAECAAAFVESKTPTKSSGLSVRSEPSGEGGDVSHLVDAYNDAIDAASGTLDEFPLALTWKHCIAIESAARRVSKLVFAGRPDVTKGHNHQHGVVLLAFANVHALWRQEIARGICAQEAGGNDTAVPSMASATVVRNAVIALLCPGAHMGVFRMAQSAMTRVDSFIRRTTRRTPPRADMGLAVSEDASGEEDKDASREEDKGADEVEVAGADADENANVNVNADGGKGTRDRNGVTQMNPRKSAVVPAAEAWEESIGNPMYHSATRTRIHTLVSTNECKDGGSPGGTAKGTTETSNVNEETHSMALVVTQGGSEDELEMAV